MELEKLVENQHDKEESVYVVLARMEGSINLVLDKLGRIVLRADRQEVEVSKLKELTQTLDEQARARDKTAIALAQALKDADDARRDKDTKTWSPFAKTLAAVVGIAAVMSLLLIYFPHK